VAGDVEHFTERLGAKLVFAIEAFGTRVAMVRLTEDAPALLLAEHLTGDQPVMVHNVADLERAVDELEDRGVATRARFEIPRSDRPWSSTIQGLSASRSTRRPDLAPTRTWPAGETSD
jgi:hypothetical protein